MSILRSLTQLVRKLWMYVGYGKEEEEQEEQEEQEQEEDENCYS